MTESEKNPSCAELFESISGLADEGASPEDMGDALRHLEECPPCKEFRDSLEATRILLSRLGETVEPDAAEKAVLRECLELVRKKLAGAGG